MMEWMDGGRQRGLQPYRVLLSFVSFVQNESVAGHMAHMILSGGRQKATKALQSPV